MKYTVLGAFSILCPFAFCAPSQALVLSSQSVSFSDQLTELNAEPLLTVNLYSPNPGEIVDSVVITLDANLSTAGTVTNNNAGTSTFRVTSVADQYDFIPSGVPTALATIINPLSPITGGTIIGSQQLFSSVPVGATRPFTLQTVSGSTTQTFTNVSDIAAFLGSGSFSYAPSTLIGTLIAGGGGNVSANLTTLAGASLTIEYNGTATPVPFEFNPAMGVMVTGSFLAIKYLLKNKSN